MDLHERIKIARRTRGLTQQYVADHFGIARVSVTQWEGKTSRPDQSKLKELATLFGVTTDWLLDGDTGRDAKISPKDDARGGFMVNSENASRSELSSKEAMLIRRPAPRRIYLAEWRHRVGLHASAAAAVVGQDSDYYQFLEHRPHKLTIEQLEQLAHLIGIEFDQLLVPPPPASPKKADTAGKIKQKKRPQRGKKKVRK